MKCNPVDDILDKLQELGFGTRGRTLLKSITYERRNNGQEWIRVYSMPGAVPPEPLSEVDTTRIGFEVCGGIGEEGDTKGGQTAMRLYQAMELITWDGYLRIVMDGPPTASVQGDKTVYNWTADIIRYYGGIICH